MGPSRWSSGRVSHVRTFARAAFVERVRSVGLRRSGPCRRRSPERARPCKCPDARVASERTRRRPRSAPARPMPTCARRTCGSASPLRARAARLNARIQPTRVSGRANTPHVTKYTEYDDTTLNQFSFDSFLYRILYNGAESVKKTIERKLG